MGRWLEMKMADIFEKNVWKMKNCISFDSSLKTFSVVFQEAFL